jgi:hypothetical protein
LGQWRAVVDLSKAIEQDLGSQLDTLSEKDLKSQLKSCPPIKYEITTGDNGLPTIITLGSADVQSKLSS